MLKRPSRNSILIGASGVLIVAFFVELRWHPVVNWLRAQDWPQTGLNEYTTKRTVEKNPKGEITTTEEIQTKKTIWDYFQLAGTVAVPLVLGFGGFWLNQQEQRRTREREEQDQKRAEENLTRERERAEENYRQEQKRAEETLREQALQTYFDRISELLLNNNLGKPYPKNNPAQDIARARTLTVLQSLGQDGERKGAILRFLYEAGLLNNPEPVVKLHHANLSGANLILDHLSGGSLREVNLSEANLSAVQLFGADLFMAYLPRANLYRANLCNAILAGADLVGAYLKWADLSGANLSLTDLREATYDRLTSFPHGFNPDEAGMLKED